MNTLNQRMRNAMPIFEYKCDKCGTTKDRIVAYSDRKEESECHKCFNGTLKFIDKVHTGNFQLKGIGWYESDYKHK